MDIFTLLGKIIDDIRLGEIKNRVDNGVDIDINIRDIGEDYLLSLCEDSVDVCDKIRNENRDTVTLGFRKNPQGRGELKTVAFESSSGQTAGQIVVCEIGEKILESVSEDYFDCLYFELCDEIML